MTLPTFTANETLTAAQLTAIIAHLQGEASSKDAYHFRAADGEDVTFTLSDNAAARSLTILDSDDDQVFKVNSNGIIILGASDVVASDVNGRFTHEAGGLEADISAVVQNDIVLGSGAGAMSLGRGWVLAKESTVEGTTTSTGDLVTVSSIPSIATTVGLRVEFDFRKSAGAAAVVFGLKLNTTEIITTNGSFDIAATADNEAQSGHASIICGPRDDANYLRNITGMMSVAGATGIDAHTIGSGAAQPSAAITSVVVTVLTNGSSLTAGVNNVQVYTLN